MARTILALLAGVALLANGCKMAKKDSSPSDGPVDSQLKEFTPSNGAFKIQMPGTPKEQTQKFSGIDTKVYLLEQNDGAFNDGAYIVSETPFPVTGKMSDAEQKDRLKGAQAGALANVYGTLTREEEVKLKNKYLGRAFEGKIKLPKKPYGDAEGALKSRIYFANGNLYQVMAIGTVKWVASNDVNKFLDSFELK